VGSSLSLLPFTNCNSVTKAIIGRVLSDIRSFMVTLFRSS
jgi:hypothetical protein